MSVPVYMSGTKVGEADSISDVIEIARSYGVRRFVVYASIRGNGDKPVSPSELEELLRSGNVESITIIRKEIAGAVDIEDTLKSKLIENINSDIAEYKIRLNELKEKYATIKAKIIVLERKIKALEELKKEIEGIHNEETVVEEPEEEKVWEV